MVYKDLFEDFSKLFYNWPSEPKPPLDHFPIYANKKMPIYTQGNPYPSSYVRSNKLTGYEIQMALAGFSEDDVSVWHEGPILHIEGNNKHNGNIADKFTCAFHHKISCAKELDLSQSKVELKNGILSIQIPIDEKNESRTYLLGKKKDD